MLRPDATIQKSTSTKKWRERKRIEMNAKESVPKLKGLLRLLESQCQRASELSFYPYDAQQLEEVHTIFQTRRKRKLLHEIPSHVSVTKSFHQLVSRHRFVCFFIVQGTKQFHNSHAINLRRRLASDYNDYMTTFLVSLGKDSDTEDSLFALGTGFAVFPSSSTFMALLNVTQVPTIVIIDSLTGRPIPQDAILAMEWNDDPQFVIHSWQQGKSGLSAGQKTLSVLSFQSTCIIT